MLPPVSPITEPVMSPTLPDMGTTALLPPKSKNIEGLSPQPQSTLSLQALILRGLAEYMRMSSDLEIERDLPRTASEAFNILWAPYEYMLGRLEKMLHA